MQAAMWHSHGLLLLLLLAAVLHGSYASEAALPGAVALTRSQIVYVMLTSGRCGFREVHVV